MRASLAAKSYRSPMVTAQDKSVADQVVQNVLKNVERYEMYLAD